MDNISQVTFSNVFSLITLFQFYLKFHRSLFLRTQLTIWQHWFRYWLGTIQVTGHYLNQWWLVYRHTFVSLGLNELKNKALTTLSSTSIFTSFRREYTLHFYCYWYFFSILFPRRYNHICEQTRVTWTPESLFYSYKFVILQWTKCAWNQI